jgi:hypothetical protein
MVPPILIMFSQMPYGKYIKIEKTVCIMLSFTKNELVKSLKHNMGG